MPPKTSPRMRYTGLLAIGAIAALFLVLPRSGGDAKIEIVASEGETSLRPSAVTVEEGDRVLFVNRTRETHTATCQGCPWSSADIQPGASAFVVFGGEGAFRLFCKYHADAQQAETATITVG